MRSRQQAGEGAEKGAETFGAPSPLLKGPNQHLFVKPRTHSLTSVRSAVGYRECPSFISPPAAYQCSAWLPPAGPADEYCAGFSAVGYRECPSFISPPAAYQCSAWLPPAGPADEYCAGFSAVGYRECPSITCPPAAYDWFPAIATPARKTAISTDKTIARIVFIYVTSLRDNLPYYPS